jgi:hypothetical protein
MIGFIFAFYRFSLLKHASLLERMVHAATGDDAIHVAIIPARMSPTRTVEALDCAYTAFIGTGVTTQPVSEVFGNTDYALYFVPAASSAAAAPENFNRGRAFLGSVVGTHYNNLSLLSTLLPRRCKQSIPSWVSHENKAHMPGREPALFCSQLGLMLCTIIDLPHSMDPAACSPGDLERHIITRAFPLDDSSRAVWNGSRLGISSRPAPPSLQLRWPLASP